MTTGLNFWGAFYLKINQNYSIQIGQLKVIYTAIDLLNLANDLLYPAWFRIYIFDAEFICLMQDIVNQELELLSVYKFVVAV